MKSHWIYCSIFCFWDSSCCFAIVLIHSFSQLYDISNGNAVIHSTVDEHLGCFQFFAFTNGGALTILVPVSWCRYEALNQRVSTRSGTARSEGTLIFCFTGTVKLLLKFTLPPAMCKCSSCSTLLPKLGIHSFIHSFIHSLNKKLLRTYYVPATILGAGNAVVNTTDKNTCLLELKFCRGDIKQDKQLKYIAY